MRVTSIDEPTALPRSNGGLPGLASETFQQHCPDQHLVAWRGDALAARCSLWWREMPSRHGQRLGVIGHYAAQDADAARLLLARATVALAGQDCERAVGPMDGATWRSYRFVTEQGPEEPFFLEPQNPLAYPQHFEQVGFQQVERYRSALVPDVAAIRPQVDAELERNAVSGVQVRSLRADAFDDELERLYEVTRASFRKNVLYAPPPKSAFLRRYRALRDAIDPCLVRLSERDGQLVGFCFSVPDRLQAEHGTPVDTAIIKTLAVRPDLRGEGLGSYLVADAHRQAECNDYRRVIHALMHDDNRSGRISARYGHTMRRYALFGRDT